MKNIFCSIAMVLLFSALMLTDCLAAEKAIDKDVRCSVCGMFVAKYPNWSVTLTMNDGAVKYFDGVKDMMAFYFAPQKYGVKTGATITAIAVNDYYTLSPVDARKSFYVVGSDVTGPMGHEFIPFATKESAEAFSKDHQGKNILTFEGITLEQVEAMRTGQRMK